MFGLLIFEPLLPLSVRQKR